MNNGKIFLWEPESLQGYSMGWSLETLVTRGLPDVAPPRSLNEFLDQISLLAHSSKSEWIGPSTFNSLDAYMAHFFDENTPKEQLMLQLEDFFQKLGELEVTISLDLVPRPRFKKDGCTQSVLDLINNSLMSVYQARLEEGSFEPRVYVNLYPETSWRSRVLDKCLKLSFLYGQPIYQNFITGTIRPMSLRPKPGKPDYNVTYLRLGGPLGNADDESVVGYACINLASLGAEARSEEDFFESVDEQVEVAVAGLDEKRARVEDRLRDGSMPYTGYFVDNLEWGFSVITLVGMNEALETLIDAPLSHVAGKAVTYKVLEHLLRKLEKIQAKNRHLYSLESYPSEIPGAKLLEQSNLSNQYLTAATELKPSHGDDLWDILEHEKKLHSMYTGGTLLQIHLDRGLDYNEGLKLLIQRTIKEFGYNYLAISPVFSLCPQHGYIKGDSVCPLCGGKAETYTRVDGKMMKTSELMDSLKEVYRQRVYCDIKNE